MQTSSIASAPAPGHMIAYAPNAKFYPYFLSLHLCFILSKILIEIGPNMLKKAYFFHCQHFQ